MDLHDRSLHKPKRNHSPFPFRWANKPKTSGRQTSILTFYISFHLKELYFFDSFSICINAFYNGCGKSLCQSIWIRTFFFFLVGNYCLSCNCKREFRCMIFNRSSVNVYYNFQIWYLYIRCSISNPCFDEQIHLDWFRFWFKVNVNNFLLFHLRFFAPIFSFWR